MKVLLIVSHGSRRKESNDEVRRLAERITEQAGSSISTVRCAFLELTHPTIDAAIETLAGEGATEIVVFPFFLAAGTHVVNDIPRIIDEARGAFPGVSISMVSHLGALPGLIPVILDHIE